MGVDNVRFRQEADVGSHGGFTRPAGQAGQAECVTAVCARRKRLNLFAEPTMRCACGLSYVPGSPEDEVRHQHDHAEYVRGPRIEELSRLRPIGEIRGFPLLLIDADTPLDVARKVAYVAMIAQREIDGKAGFYGDGTADQQLLVLADGDRCIAMAFLATVPYVWSLLWDDAKLGHMALLNPQVIDRSTPVIARVWVAADYRRRGLAEELLGQSMKLRAMSPDAVCWELPFTAGGEALARKFCPSTFFGSCDGYIMGQILAGNRER